MSDQRREYGKRPASADTGARMRSQYDKPYGKKPYQGERKNSENGDRGYGKPARGIAFMRIVYNKNPPRSTGFPMT